MLFIRTVVVTWPVGDGCGWSAIRSGSLERLRSKFRRADALLAPRCSLLDGEELVNIVPNDLRGKAARTMVAGGIKHNLRRLMKERLMLRTASDFLCRLGDGGRGRPNIVALRWTMIM